MANKILILGAKGNLGGELVKAFADSGEVVAWDKGEIDITDRDLIMKKIADLKPELVINAAAYNGVDKCETDEAEYELAKKINIDGPKFLAEACLMTGAALIHYSTDYVFDGKKKRGYAETDEPKPINRYGKSKWHGEKRVLEYSGKGLKWYLIRTSKLFGRKGSSSMAKENFFDLMLKLAKSGQEIKAVNDEISCFTYAPDLARATKELYAGDYGYGIYHLTNAGAASWYGAAMELIKLNGERANLKAVPGEKLARAAKRPKHSILLNTKLPVLRDYREALKEYLNLK